VNGAGENNIPEAIANQISMIGKHLRVTASPRGTPRITALSWVQTGYLKAHYPVEYMTALMSVSKNEIEKVALYAADCRRMSIQVLPRM